MILRRLTGIFDLTSKQKVFREIQSSASVIRVKNLAQYYWIVGTMVWACCHRVQIVALHFNRNLTSKIFGKFLRDVLFAEFEPGFGRFPSPQDTLAGKNRALWNSEGIITYYSWDNIFEVKNWNFTFSIHKNSIKQHQILLRTARHNIIWHKLNTVERGVSYDN